MLVLLSVLHLCACGGATSTDSDPPLESEARRAGRAYRVLAIVNDPNLTIVSFDDLANPERVEAPIPSMGYRAYDVQWSFDGRRLAAATTDTEINCQAYFGFSEENWTTPERLTKTRLESAAVRFRWLGDGRYLTVYHDHFRLARTASNRSTHVPIGDSDLFAWSGDVGPSYLIQDGTRFYWFHPERETVEIRANELVWFQATRGGNQLVLIYEGEGAPIASDHSNIWSVKGKPQEGCTPTKGSDNCFARVGQMENITGTSLSLVSTFAVGAEGSWRSLSVREFGSDTPLSTNAGDLGVLRAWGPDSAERCFPGVVSNKIWVYCAKGEDGVQIERFEVNSKSIGSVDVTALAPAGLRFRSPSLVGSKIFAQELGEADEYPEAWKAVDLRSDRVEWTPVDARGELILTLGRRGAIFIDTLGDPEDLSLPCAPCSFTAIQDVRDPSSPVLTGTFDAPHAPSYPERQRTFWPAPDGSGVLTLEDGVLFYENFSAPGVRFPLTEVAEGSSIYLPPTWGN